MAYFRRKPPKGLIQHSDRGSQYASHDYQQLIKSYSMICGMGKKGDCCDNAVAESFFHFLKAEWLGDAPYDTRDQAKRDVVAYIEMFYNSKRLHSFIGYAKKENWR